VNPRPWWAKLGHLSLILLATVYCVFPVYFVLVQSLKTAQEDVFGNPFIVLHPTFESFEELFEGRGEGRGIIGSTLRRSYPFLDWLENTLFVFAGTLAITLAVSLAAAYALGRLRPPGFRWWRRAIFATYVIPQTILFVPLYRVVIVLKHVLGCTYEEMARILQVPENRPPHVARPRDTHGTDRRFG